MNDITFLSQNISYFLIGIFVFIWIYAILRVAKDISWRTENFGLQLISILLILFLTPFLGLPVYYLIRPLSKKSDTLSSELIGGVVCYHCHKINNKEFAYCVFCGEILKVECPYCKKPIGVDYEYCPRCGKENLELQQNKKSS